MPAKGHPVLNWYGDRRDGFIEMVLFAGDNVVPCTPRRDIDVPYPAKMLIGQKFNRKKGDLVF